MKRSKISLNRSRKNLQTEPNLKRRLGKKRHHVDCHRYPKRAVALQILEDSARNDRRIAESTLVVINKQVIDHTHKQLKAFTLDENWDEMLAAEIKATASTCLNVYSRPPSWEFLRERERVQCYIAAMKEICRSSELNLIPFTIRLSNTLIEGAVNSHNGDGRNFLSYVSDRFNSSIRRTIGRSVDYWQVVEISPAGRIYPSYSSYSKPKAISFPGSPHLHGHFLLRDSEEKLFRQAIHSVNEPYHDPAFKRRAIVRSRSRKCAAGWGSYATKDLFGTSIHLLGSQLLYATNPVKCAAKIFYTEARDQIVQTRDLVRPALLKRVDEIVNGYDAIAKSSAEATLDECMRMLSDSGSATP